MTHTRRSAGVDTRSCRYRPRLQYNCINTHTHLPCIQIFFFNDLIRRLSTRVFNWPKTALNEQPDEGVKQLEDPDTVASETQWCMKVSWCSTLHNQVRLHQMIRYQWCFHNQKNAKEVDELEQVAWTCRLWTIFCKRYIYLGFKGCSEIWCTEVYYTLIILYKNCAHHYIIINDNKLNHRGTVLPCRATALSHK